MKISFFKSSNKYEASRKAAFKKEQVDAIIVMLAVWMIVVIRQLENADYTMS